MSEKKVNLLIKFSHGLGDTVQLGVILKHLARYRPLWNVDVRTGKGKHTALIGLCRQVFHDGEPDPPGPYDMVQELGFYENYLRQPSVPNTKVTNCLHEVFGISYNAELERYTINVSDEAKQRASAYFDSIGAKQANGRYNVFILHYEGNTSQTRKNLNWHQAAAICSFARDLGLIPVILDWDKRSHLPDQKTIFNPGVKTAKEGPDLWGNIGTGDADTITALISLASLYIGVDSGPGKCASATDTPTLICWKEMHPMQFHDPAENTTHLLPDTWETMPPCENEEVRECFKRKYIWLTYKTKHDAEHSLVEEALIWMQQNLEGAPPMPAKEGLVYRWGYWLPKFHDLFCFWTIIEDVDLRDGYKTKLRPKVEGVEYVVDIGACIGAFSRLWHKRNPEARIACVEIHPKLGLALKENVADFAKVFNKACWYETTGKVKLLDCFSKDSRNVGDSRIIDWGGLQRGYPQWYTLTEDVETITLEAICKACGFPRIDILKLDCEGSEINILGNCDLSKVGTIFCESHDPDAWRALVNKKFRGWDIGHMHVSEDRRFELWHLVNPNPPITRS